MNFLKQIRQQHHISQEGLAAMLNVSRSYIAMVEAGQRDLPAAALTKLSHLQRNDKAALAIARQPLAKVPMAKITTAQNDALHKILSARLVKLRHQQWILQQKLSKAEALHHKAMDTLLQVSAQHTVRSLKPAAHIEQVWLRGMEATAKLELNRMPLHQLELLKIKLEVLEAEIRVVEGRIVPTAEK
ncbi:helix-turn-helix transcriptional regulator [Ferruginibacter sp. HRS2-29]|uniref:helix-turn-helix transcriptional regulator n=1 Tax=Ferruginibacter sp. HRS2-29 TaxID=2487334 RepID=UPI0020CC88C8